MDSPWKQEGAQFCAATLVGSASGSRNVKRWRNAEMALRWTAAGMLEAQKTFRRLKAYRQLTEIAWWVFRPSTS